MLRARAFLLIVLLPFVGCSPRSGKVESLAFPVMTLEPYGPKVFADAQALGSTMQKYQYRYRGMALMDVQGRRFHVETVKELQAMPWFMKLGGIGCPRLVPEGGMDLAEAKGWIRIQVVGQADYLDQIDGGRPKVVAEIERDPSLGAVFAQFAGPWSFPSVMEEARRKVDLANHIAAASDPVPR